MCNILLDCASDKIINTRICFHQSSNCKKWEKNNTKICGENIACAKRPNFVRSKILACTKRPIFVQSKYFACPKWLDFAQNKPRKNILAPQRKRDIRRTGKTRSCDPSGHITPSFEDSAFFPFLFTLSFLISHLILLLHLSSSSWYRHGTVLYCIETIARIISYIPPTYSY